MTNCKSTVALMVTTALLLSACMGREGVVGQQAVAGQADGASASSGNNERRALLGQQRRVPKDDEPVPDLSPKPTEKIMTAQERFAGAALAHNAVRAKHNLSKLIWSDTLANYAQQWADHLAKVNNCQLNHRPASGAMQQEYGENLWWSAPDIWSDGSEILKPATISSVVESWASEAGNYDYDSNSCEPGKQCNNYTQIVWQDTTSVGCGYQQCSDKSQVWVCNYNPPGNYIDKKPY